jgi:penicillin-binding protein 1A
VKTKRIVPDPVAKEGTQILQSVITSGTGRSAQIGAFAAGKTGTTENYQDAWFVGFNDSVTVAVWVGYPEGAKPMETEYHGQPVAGGTFPAEIWRDFLLSVDKIRTARQEAKAPKDVPVGTTGPVVPAPAVPAQGTTGGQGTGKAKQKKKRPSKAPAPQIQPTEPTPNQPQPAPTPTQPGQAPPTGTGGGEAGTGGAGGAGTGKP